MSIMKISSHIGTRSVTSYRGAFGTWQLPVWARHIRGRAPVPARESLPLFAVPQAFRDVRPHPGTRAALAVQAALGRGVDPRLPARGRQGEGVLRRVRLVALRGRLAGRR